jgi:uncharacterized protein YoxC
MMRAPPGRKESVVAPLGLTGGDVALIILAVGWCILVLFLAVMLLALFRVLGQTESLLQGIREQTVPLLGEVRITVTNVNKQLERADTVMEAAGKMSKSATRLVGAVESAVASPLIKFAAFSAGASAAIKRLRGNK